LKREDRNPSRSHKDRGLLVQIAAHAQDVPRWLALSSSGNAAVAAARHCARTGDHLLAFVAPGTAPAKLRRLLDSGAVVVETLKPVNFVRYVGRVFGLPDLRGTRDPLASVGYRTLAAELVEEMPGLDAFVTWSSSGISMEGVLDGFEGLGQTARPWAVQGGECVGLARALDPSVPIDTDCPAGRLGVKNPPHADTIANGLRGRGGGALVARAHDVRRWMDRLPELDLAVAPEGAGVLAGLEQLGRGPLRGARVAAVMTGAPDVFDPADGTASRGREPLRLSSYLELRDLLLSLGLSPIVGADPGTLA
jgi:threonine dehydratase